MTSQVNRADLETKVQAMYRDVAQNPHGEFHFEMGRAMAERLGYRPTDLDRIPAEAIDSFAAWKARACSTWAAAPAWTPSLPA